jgi:hypothetical protein
VEGWVGRATGAPRSHILPSFSLVSLPTPKRVPQRTHSAYILSKCSLWRDLAGNGMASHACMEKVD